MLKSLLQSIYHKLFRYNNVPEPARVSGVEFSIDKTKISQNALKVVTRIGKAGFQSYLVGGCVRDLMVGLQPKDFDVVTNAEPKEIKKLFRNSLYIGRRFKIIHVLFGRDFIEVCTFRRDRHKIFAFMGDKKKNRMLANNTYGRIDHDVYRRDFTINALYFNCEKNEIIDYVGGVDDIRHKRICMIGEVNIRLTEDPIRILRAIRFAAKLDFILADEVVKGIESYKSRLLTGSSERLFLEVIKLFDNGHGLRSYQMLVKHKLMDVLLPGFTRFTHAKHKEKFTALIEQVLVNADQRIAENKRVSTPFILAVLLWACFMSSLDTVKYTRKQHHFKYPKAIHKVFKSQLKFLAVPRRVLDVIGVIWEFQLLFSQSHGDRAARLTSHPRFRAAYDLLLLRAKIDPSLANEAVWWSEYLKKHPIENHSKHS